MKPLTPPPARRRLFQSAPSRPKRATPPPQPFQAFIAYADLPAARRALREIDEVLGLTAGKFALKPMLWRFDQLANAKWCDGALNDAGEAAVVVLASSASGPLPAAIEQWVTTLLNRKRRGKITLVSLQGKEEAWTITVEAPVATAEVSELPTPVANAA